MSQFAAVPVARIFASPTNPRKTFDEAALAELAESILRHGVLQPVLLRPHPTRASGHYELVAGERRWRAAKVAKLAEIPATVRDLTDAEVLEIQVVENLQREDIHPLEEAAGYEALLRCEHAGGAPYTVEEIAAKVGKSKSYVYQRMRLTALGGKAREAFVAGKVDAARALLIARIDGVKRQDEAFTEICDNGYVMPIAEARDFLRREFMQGLAKPPFDVSALYFAGKTSAQPVGPKCTDCPKRTLNQPHLFEDFDKGDFCTDTACFSAKALAHVEVEAEKLRAKGKTVLTGEDAKKVFPSSYGGTRGGYVELDSWCYDSRLKVPGAKWKDLLKGLKPEIVHVAWPHYPPGEWRKVVSTKAALELLEAAGMLKAEPKAKAPAETSEVKARMKEQHLLEEINLEVHKGVREAATKHQPGSPGYLATLRVVVRELWAESNVDMEIQDIAAPDGELQFAKMTEGELLGVLVDLACPSLGFEDDARRELAKLFEVDAKAIEKQVRAEAKAAEKAAAKPETPAAPKVEIVPIIKPAAKEKKGAKA